MKKPPSNNTSIRASITGLSQSTLLKPKTQLKMIKSDYFAVLLIVLGFMLAGIMQFVSILGLDFTPKIFIMPLVMAAVFSVVVTRLRIVRRRLKYERDQKDFVKTQIQFLNHRLKDLLDQRTELLIEAQDQVALAQTRANLGAMSAGVIHDLNNALTAIKMGWEGLKYAEDDEIEECQESISSGIERAVLISREFRSFIRPQTTAKKTEVKELSTRLVSMLKRSMHPRQSLELIWGTQHSLCMTAHEWVPSTEQSEPESDFQLFACISEAHLTQILMNLIVNARDALTDQGGQVQLVISSNNEQVIFEVIDNGVGMPIEIRQQIFEPFFTTKPQGQGTGLGLHVLNNLVQRADGHIKLDSIEGKGTHIIILIPQVRPQTHG